MRCRIIHFHLGSGGLRHLVVRKPLAPVLGPPRASLTVLTTVVLIAVLGTSSVGVWPACLSLRSSLAALYEVVAPPLLTLLSHVLC